MTKAYPQRTCIGCRQIKNKREMIRLVRTAENEVEIDITGKKGGRGAYLCYKRSCWEAALNSQHLEYAFKIRINQENLLRLAEAGKKLLEETTGG